MWKTTDSVCTVCRTTVSSAKQYKKPTTSCQSNVCCTCSIYNVWALSGTKFNHKYAKKLLFTQSKIILKKEALLRNISALSRHWMTMWLFCNQHSKTVCLQKHLRWHWLSDSYTSSTVVFHQHGFLPTLNTGDLLSCTCLWERKSTFQQAQFLALLSLGVQVHIPTCIVPYTKLNVHNCIHMHTNHSRIIWSSTLIIAQHHKLSQSRWILFAIMS